MSLTEILLAIRKEPEAYFRPVDCVALEAFIRGYMATNAKLWTAFQLLSEELAGQTTWDATTIMFLREPDDHKAVIRVLDGLIQTLATSEHIPPPPDLHLDDAWAPSILDGIRQGRPGMYLGESNVFWLNNYVNGFLAGLRARNPVAAEEQERELADFERYLQRYFKKPGIQWYKLIRIYGGVYIDGLNEFAKRWDEWKASCQSPGVEGLVDDDLDTSDE